MWPCTYDKAEGIGLGYTHVNEPLGTSEQLPQIISVVSLAVCAHGLGKGGAPEAVQGEE